MPHGEAAENINQSIILFSAIRTSDNSFLFSLYHAARRIRLSACPAFDGATRRVYRRTFFPFFLPTFQY
jgi:hypothetical protein